MKSSILLFILFLSLTSTATIANTDEIKKGKQLFKTHCASCHGVAGGMDMSKRTAPPVIAVRRHYIGTYPDKFSFVNTIADWVEKPDGNKTQMRGAIHRFGLMPKIVVNRDDVEKIAAYIFEGKIDSPAGFQEHVKQMHGNH